MLKVAQLAFLLLIFSLAFMKDGVSVGRLIAGPTDLLFLVTVTALGLAVLRGETRLRWNRWFIVLIVYFAALAVSVFASDQPERGWVRLASLLYLVSLPVLAYTLIDSAERLRTVFVTWLAASAVPAVLGALTVLLFALGVDRSLLDYPLHEFGTLPAGNYPRIEATFNHPAMLCNYLTVSLMMLLVGRHVGWVGGAVFYALLGAILLTAIFTLTPGLGGIFLALGVWGFLKLRGRKPVPAFASLALGSAAAVLFVGAASVTPIIHPTAPYLVELPGIDRPVAPAVRMLTWTDAAENFSQHPLLGSGLGTNPAEVDYVDPAGGRRLMIDAHNVFLNIAAQSGLLGLAALALLIAAVFRRTAPIRLDDSRIVTVGLGLAWLNAFVYQGLTGSYEDARHLWVLVGLLLANWRLQAPGVPPLASPRGTP